MRLLMGAPGARRELKGSAKYTFVHLNGTKFRLTREVI